MVHRDQGNLTQAIDELATVVDLDQQVDHPDLESDTAMLSQVRTELADRGSD